MKRTTALLLSFILIFGMVTPSAYANNTERHWAAEELEKWHNYEVINGYEDLDLKPNQEITKAEIAQIVYNLFGYEKAEMGNSFNDVAEDQWYSVAIEKGLEVGYLELGDDENFYPDKDLSRSEAAVILYNAFQMAKENQALDKENILEGLDSIDEEIKSKVSFMAAKGYINGYPDGTFKGSNTITRGEIITIVDRIVDTYVNKDKMVVEDEKTGNILVVGENASIKNTILDGTLFVSEAIGESDLLVESSEVKGNLVIEGGGSESIHLKNSIFTSVIGNKRSGNPLRISVEGNTIIENLFIEKGMTLENNSSNSQIKNVLIGKNITSEDLVKLVGDFNSLVINSNGAQLRLIGNVKNLVNNGVNSINDKKYGKGKFGSVVPANDTATRKASSNSNVSPWTIVWRDEFSSETLDTTKWKYETGNWIVDDAGNGIDAGWGNNEKQFYTDSEENIYLEDGKLVLTAKVEETTDQFGTYDYTSGKLVTNGLFSKKYGKIQARMKLPPGQGLWPAFWMMPKDSVYGDWAASGEIDIMEAAGSKPGHIGGTIHYGGVWPNNTYTGEEYDFAAGEDITDYHVYEIEWEPGEIRWYVDGKHYSTKNNWYARGEGESLNYSYPAPFDQEFYMILNLAVGGWYDGDPEDDSVLPASVLVDYVRVYELTGRDYRDAEVPAFEPEALPDNGKLPLEDGNLVYNNNYDGTQLGNLDTETVDEGIYLEGIEGLAETDFWYLLTGFNGEASVSIDSADETSNYAKVDISAGGNESYAVQLVQDISLAKGNHYKLSFDAKAASNRDIAVKIGGDENDGWTAYTTEGFSLSNTVESFEHTFQMTENTDLDARLEFNLGLNTNSVWLGNVRVEAIEPPEIDYDASKKPLESGNRVYNGTFDQGDQTRFNYWHLLTTDGNATPTVDEESRELLVDISEAGIADDSIQLVQKGIQLNANSEYTLTFDARGAVARDLSVALTDAEGTSEYLETEIVAINEMMETYTVEFTMPDETDLNSELHFYLGGSDSNITIDNIKLIEDEPDYGLEVMTFDSESDLLTPWSEGSDALSQTITDGELAVAIESVSSLAYSPKLEKFDMALENGETYQVSFDARADVARKIQLNLGQGLTSDPWFIPYMDAKVIELTDTMKNYSYEFTVDEETSKNLKVVFEFGNVDGDSTLTTVYLDNLKVEKAVAYGLDTMTFDNEDNLLIPWSEGSDALSQTLVDGELAVAIESVGSEAYSPKLEKFDMALENGKTYQVSFDARADVPRKIQLNLGQGLDAAPWFIPYMDNQVIELTDTMKNYAYEFTVNEETSKDLKVALEFGNVDGDTTLTTAYFDNLKVEEVEEEVVEEPEIVYGLETLTFDDSSETLTVYSTVTGPAITTTAGALEVKMQESSDEAWHQQVFYEGFGLENGKTYVVSFEGMSDVDNTINLQLGKQDGGSFTPYMDAQVINLTNSMNVFSHEFTVTEATDSNLKLGFELGTISSDNIPSTLTFDNIKVEEVYGLETLTFDDSSQTLDVYSTVTGPAITTTAGALKVEMQGTSGDAWDPQIYHEGFGLENGKTYIVSFEGMSDVDNTINLQLGKQDGGSFTPYMDAQVINLTNSMNDFSHEFTVTESTDSNLKLGFELGTISADNIPSTLTFDNIEVEEVLE